MKLLSLALLISTLPFSASTLTAGEREHKSYKDVFLYEASIKIAKWRNSRKGCSWWNRIGDKNIYLGSLPMWKRNHHNLIPEEGIRNVLAVVEPFEMEEGMQEAPVTPEMWREKGVNFFHIPAEDYKALNIEQLNLGTSILKERIRAGEKIYVHCKAGRGRSSMVVIGYLMRYEGMTYEEAYTLVKGSRDQVAMNPHQRNVLKCYEWFIKNSGSDWSSSIGG